MFKIIISIIVISMLVACGGGSGAATTNTTTTQASPPTPVVQATNLIAIGNSITLYTNQDDWVPSRGLAASDLAHDYVHLVGHSLGFADSNIKANNVAAFERDDTRTDLIFSSTDSINEQSVVIVELGENTAGNDAWMAAFPASYSALLNAVMAKNPAKLICLSTYWQNIPLDAQKKSICAAHGGTWIDIAGIYYSNLDTVPVGENPAYAAHPHNNSMAAMANAILAVLKK